MLSLRDKLRATQGAPRRSAPVRAPAQDCYVRETRFPLPDGTRLADGMLALMQGDPNIPHHIDPGDFLFLDTETTGLSHGAGTVAFLVGVGLIEDGALTVRQYLMRDYDEEPFVLRRTRDDLERRRVLVTFNGRSFDMPLLETRFIMQRMPFDTASIPHADLLHTARRVWKLRLRRCNLGALEELIFHEPREDDLPGAEVPQRYFDYLKSKDFSLLEDVLRHNALDIVSLARLLFRLGSLHENPLTAEHLQDIYSLGRVYERRGRLQTARMCYRAADAGSMSALSRERLAETLRREKQPAEAAAIYEKMIAARQGGAKPYIALCKLLEHRLHAPGAAADIARRGMLYLSDLPPGERTQADFDDLTRRYARLLQKSRKDS